MILHCVFVKFRSDVDSEERTRAFADLAALEEKVEGFLEMVSGANSSFEGMARGYEEGFVIVFADRAAHLAYHEHPEHKAAGARLAQLCEGGLDGILVFDFDTGRDSIGAFRAGHSRNH